MFVVLLVVMSGWFSCTSWQNSPCRNELHSHVNDPVFGTQRIVPFLSHGLNKLNLYTVSASLFAMKVLWAILIKTNKTDRSKDRQTKWTPSVNDKTLIVRNSSIKNTISSSPPPFTEVAGNWQWQNGNISIPQSYSGWNSTGRGIALYPRCRVLQRVNTPC